MAQILLIAAGYTHRATPSVVLLHARSGSHASAISQRLASSSTKTRYVGLVVGTAISGLVDKPEVRINFEVPEMSTPETQWYLSLTQIRDEVGSLYGLQRKENPRQRPGHAPSHIEIASVDSTPTKKYPNIREISPSADEDADLIPYDKVVSDPEDEDDDPMIAHRNKPIVPV